MKPQPRMSFLVLVLTCASASAWAQAAPQSQPGADAAIQAIQQAPDPSAAVAAYAIGFAAGRNNPRLDEAYVGRMVDLGLPEMAYHQAQTLTTQDSSNGLAWGVVGYVDARRGQMPDAVSAINLAGQFAPENKFVEHTAAGEIIAWYDFKADKASLPDNAKDGLIKLRALLGKHPAFALGLRSTNSCPNLLSRLWLRFVLTVPVRSVPTGLRQCPGAVGAPRLTALQFMQRPGIRPAVPMGAIGAPLTLEDGSASY